MRSLVFYLAAAALLTHELDAVKHSEWGLLYVLRDLSETSAYALFVVLHVSIVALMLSIFGKGDRRTIGS